MNTTNILLENHRINSTDTYIEYLTTKLGASREEIIEVTRRSGISARRIAEYLLDNFDTKFDMEE